MPSPALSPPSGHLRASAPSSFRPPPHVAAEPSPSPALAATAWLPHALAIVAFTAAPPPPTRYGLPPPRRHDAPRA
eukprot:7384330-Prymnesium_polylepis.1